MARIETAKANAAAAAVLKKSAPKAAAFTVHATLLEEQRVVALVTMAGHAFTAVLVKGELYALHLGWPVG